jgi:hypothetical protein
MSSKDCKFILTTYEECITRNSYSFAPIYIDVNSCQQIYKDWWNCKEKKNKAKSPNS